MTLYIVATPIGNLEDISDRAKRILGEVDLCYAEDTRHALNLFRRFGIETKLKAYHDHSSDELREHIVRELEEGKSIALISDAGTPCISDPGYRLVKLARERGQAVEPIPGASALTAFLSASGLPTDRFTFAGFLPSKSKARRERLEGLIGEATTVVVYESPNRLEATLNELEALHPTLEVVVARELTKMFETWVRGTPAEVRDTLEEAKGWRGEIVLGFHAPAPDAPTRDEVDAWVEALLGAGLSPRTIADLLQERLELPRKELYQRALARRSAADRED